MCSSTPPSLGSSPPAPTAPSGSSRSRCVVPACPHPVPRHRHPAAGGSAGPTALCWERRPCSCTDSWGAWGGGKGGGALLLNFFGYRPVSLCPALLARSGLATGTCRHPKTCSVPPPPPPSTVPSGLPWSTRGVRCPCLSQHSPQDQNRSPGMILDTQDLSWLPPPVTCGGATPPAGPRSSGQPRNALGLAASAACGRAGAGGWGPPCCPPRGGGKDGQRGRWSR